MHVSLFIIIVVHESFCISVLEILGFLRFILKRVRIEREEEKEIGGETYF